MGPDQQLETLVDATYRQVIPRLLGNEHVNNDQGITPVVVLGDLWSGNASVGKLRRHDRAGERHSRQLRVLCAL